MCAVAVSVYVSDLLGTRIGNTIQNSGSEATYNDRQNACSELPMIKSVQKTLLF